MSLAELTPILIFLCVTVMAVAVLSLSNRNRERIDARLKRLAGKAAEEREKPGLLSGTAGVGRPEAAGQGRFAALRRRLTVAGYYRRESLTIFLSVQLALIGLCVVGAGAAILTGALETTNGLLAGGIGAALAVVIPGMFLDSQKKKRQTVLRKALPDFFDILVLCLEGGMAMPLAWRRVTQEMKNAYPPLWRELKLVEAEAELGRAMGEAIRGFAERTDLDEIGSLSSVVGQSERLGTNLGRPLRLLADALRVKRVQKAEEQAHKAATKIMFPTLLFIFPGVFAIILGPMAVQVINLFSKK